ncbi:MAG: 1-phosphofructokinase family hexose kinase [Chloroflexi bacterium]|nr:MAG: 1-phosphofructokinase family hexose kinase [Chloroflexota bacterium]
MIVTVTPNPSIDRTIQIDRLDRGRMIRARAATSEAAGKGLNVSLALATEGVDTSAVLPLAADSATVYLRLLADAVPITAVPIKGAARVNVSLVEADGTVTKVNEPGPQLGPDDVEAILAAASVAGSGWVVGCGSLPPGAPVDFYARLIALGSEDRRIAVDTSGEALGAAVCARAALIKPNTAELAELVGRPLATIGDVNAAARELIERGAHAVLVSLGPDGALLVDARTASHAEASIDDVVNTVGAGDALLAGFLAAGGGSDALGNAIAWSVAAIRSPGTRMRPVTAADRGAVIVHARIDSSRRLRS